MNEIESLHCFVDDEILLRAADSILENDCPSFSIDFEITNEKSATNDEPSYESTTVQDETSDQSRFPVYTSQDITDLKSFATNKNTSRSTKLWLSVFNNWRQSRNLEIDIVNMAPADLDKVLGQFYAEVKRKDGDDYEPESLKIMQSAIECHLK